MREGVLQKFVTVVADGATTALLHVAKAVPDVIVTDLDGVVSDIVSAQRQGSIVVIHAHGDNIEQLNSFVPDFPRAIGSTQVEPRPNVYNFLGFTDGDRAVFLAAAMGAKADCVGWDGFRVDRGQILQAASEIARCEAGEAENQQGTAGVAGAENAGRHRALQHDGEAAKKSEVSEDIKPQDLKKLV